jgi:tRNA pseudouridine65 synthase
VNLLTALPIVYRDEQLVVIDKPAGLLVHRSTLDAADTQSAAQILREQLGQSVHAVHRLDKGTSGLLLFALNPQSAREMTQAFEAGLVQKTYHAIVRGWPEEAGSIDHPLRREDEDRHRTSSREIVQDALTHYKTTRCFTLPIADVRPNGQSFDETRFALVELKPLTGRRHQLRRHMKHIAHPIIGDATHGKGPLNRAFAEHVGTTRLWLHASQLELPAELTTGAQSLFHAPHGFDRLIEPCNEPV